MKFEIIALLLHNPKVIFLDEPTISLDVIAQRDKWKAMLNTTPKTKRKARNGERMYCASRTGCT
ncbi:MAG: hypothetical protein ACOX6G_07120 [Christensenellales bacterium]|jgi:ABC-type uncharacterized transport system ATPase subunit|nr:hypothetical protein [Clostridiales bacterium]